MSSAAALAQRYAQALLRELGVTPAQPVRAPRALPREAWAASGLPAPFSPAPLASIADGALAALQALAPTPELMALRGAPLLGERRALGGPTESRCRLLRAADGWLGVNLAREEDWSLVPAWLEAELAAEDWPALAAALRVQKAALLVARARELGLAVALSAPPLRRPAPWLQRQALGTPVAAGRAAPRVLDLTALWAGPLCGQLLRLAGATVIKLESAARPDGARRGAPAFYERLNGGKQSLVLDFASAEGRVALRAEILKADIVLEASRPRALRQLGLHAEQLLAEKPGLTWLSITGYGRDPAQENALAYGDDSGVAAGLSWLQQRRYGMPSVVGDAIADPLTGLHAAVAALASHRQGGGMLCALSLRDVVARGIAFEAPRSRRAWSRFS